MKRLNKKFKKYIFTFILASILAGLMYLFPEYFEEFKTPSTQVMVKKELSEYKEKDFVRDNCQGIIEYKLPDKTRIDCLTEEYAIEFDYAKKWAESIGQAKYYALKTGKKPAVAIIMKTPQDEIYIKRIRETSPEIIVMKIKAYQ